MPAGTRVLVHGDVGTVLAGYAAYPDDVAVWFADFHVERVARVSCVVVPGA
jgi:hypothetical protein